MNEHRWYKNCEGGGKQAGGYLDFDISAYKTCEDNANGDKAYYDGFIQGCAALTDYGFHIESKCIEFANARVVETNNK